MDAVKCKECGGTNLNVGTCNYCGTALPRQLSAVVENKFEGTYNTIRKDLRHISDSVAQKKMAEPGFDSRLRDYLISTCNMEEFRTLCQYAEDLIRERLCEDVPYDFRVDPDNVRGEGKSAKILAIIQYLKRRGNYQWVLAVASGMAKKEGWY